MDISEVKDDIVEEEGLDQATLLKYLGKLTPDDIDTLALIARNEQDDKGPVSQSLTQYYELVSSVFGNNTLNTIGNSTSTRNQRYEIFDEMDESTAYISSALDILSDDATQADENGIILHIESESTKVINLVNEFIEEFELEDKVSKWARAIAKYGDLFIKVDGDYEHGVTSINDTIYPGVVDRRDLNGKLVAFTNNQDTSYTSEDLYAPWEFVHFRHKGDIYKAESNQARLGLSKDTFSKNLTSAYGQSILRPAIKVYAQLRFVENMILLSRLTNSIRRNIFLINVGDVAPDKAYETIANYARILKKDINMNIEDGIYSASKHTVNYDEDIFIPVGDPQNDVRIESVGGDANIREQYDLEYLLNKLFSSLKIPKAYLNYEQDLNARSTLIQLDIRYARSVNQLQNTIVSGITRLVNIHLAYKGLDPNELDLEITLTPVSAIDEEARAEQQQKQIANARDIWDVVSSMNDAIGEKTPMDLDVLSEYLMRDYLEIDNATINKIFGRKSDTDNDNISESIKRRRKPDGDFHAAYPTSENEIEYERIRESIISSSTDTTIDE